MRPGQWIDTMVQSVGRYMRLETTDGVTREGKITGFTYRSFKLNGSEADLPTEVEVNGDPNDRIPLDRIEFMDID